MKKADIRPKRQLMTVKGISEVKADRIITEGTDPLTSVLISSI
jgi:hypothetical protein